MIHPNDMSVWPEIACQRGHGAHATRTIPIELGGPTPYHDLAPIPRRFRRMFHMLVWDPAHYPVDGGPYCPAHDAVSETIVGLRVWEPRETTLTLQACSSAGPEQVMVDFGSQVGWFSLLAASCGMAVHAFDADAADVEILRTSAAINDWGERVLVDQYRVGPESEPWEPQPIRFAKIDIEGAEDQAVRVLWPSIEAGLVDHMLIEVSPVFADYYPDLVADLLDAGYTGYLLPPKSQPPARLDVFPDDLEAGRLDRATVRETVAAWSQENIWVARDGASW